MFTFFHRNKPLEVRFLTPVDGLVELFPPQPLSRCIPDWWKRTPAYLDAPKNSRSRPPPKKVNKSAKHCYSIQKTLERGISFPLWMDMFVTVDHKGHAHPYGPPSGPKGLGEQHPRTQYPGMLTDDWVNFKFNAMWMAYTEEPAYFYMTNPFYHMDSHTWQTMPGVIEFHWQHNLNVNTIMKKPVGSDENPAAIEYEFKAGDMLAYFIPMTERKIVIKCEQVTQQEWDRLHYGYKMFFSSATEHRNRNIGGCPYKVGDAKK